MQPPLAPIVLSRKARQNQSNWLESRSFFGGAPRLGGRSWPRMKNGKPLHFLAQLDLAEIGAVARTPLPEKGALAFFIGHQGHSEPFVLFIPHTASARPSEVPADLPPAQEAGGDIVPEGSDAAGPLLFPFWALEFNSLPADCADDEDAFGAAVQHRFGGRRYFFSAK